MSDPSAFYESLIFAGSGTLGEVLVSGIRDRFEVPGRKNFVGSMNLWMVPIYVAAPSLIHQLQPAIEYVANNLFSGDLNGLGQYMRAATRSAQWGATIAGTELLVGRACQILLKSKTCPWEHRYKGKFDSIANNTVRWTNWPAFLAFGAGGDYIHKTMHGLEWLV